VNKRVHVGCGIRCPFMKWNWIALVVGLVIMWSINLAMDTLWGAFGLLPWLVTIGLTVRWEIIHSPAKMYRTWTP